MEAALWVPPRIRGWWASGPSSARLLRILTGILLGLGMAIPPVWAQADNDRFARREVLVGESITRVSSTLAATRDAEESSVVGAGEEEASVWWSWSAPHDGAVRIRAVQSALSQPLRLQISRGDALATLTPVVDLEVSDSRGTLLRVHSGERYEIAAVAAVARPAFFTLEVAYVPAAFMRQGVLTGALNELEADFVGAAAVEEFAVELARRPAMYWDWQCTGHGRLHFALHPNSAAAGVLVFESRPGGYTVIAGAAESRSLTVSVQEGVVYRLVLAAPEELPPGERVRAYATYSTATFMSVDPGQPLPAGAVLSFVKTNLPVGIEFRTQISSFSQPESVEVVTNEPPVDAVSWRPTEGGITHAEFQLVDVAGRVWAGNSILWGTRPPNDDFVHATVLTGDPVLRRTGTGTGTLEAEEPPLPNGSKQSIWYRWTAARAGAVDVELMSSSGALSRTWALEVFRGDSLATLVAVSNLNPRPPSTQRQRVLAEVQAGEVLHVRVPSTANPNFGVPSLFLRLADRVPNDDFDRRQEIAGTHFEGEHDALFATSQTGEVGPFDRIALRSAWYRWIAPADGEVRIRTATVDGSWVLPQWFVGDAFAELRSLSGIEPDFSPASSRDILYAADAAAVYALQIDSQPQSRFETASPARFTFDFTAAPDNDAIANAGRVAGERWRVSGTLRAARGETNAPVEVRAGTTSPRRPGFRAVWHQWTAPRTGPFSVHLNSSNNVVARIYATNGFGATSTPLATASRASLANFVAATNRVYWIAVTSSDTLPGPDYQLNLFPGLPPANDAFDQPSVLTGLAPIFEATFDRATAETGDPLGRCLWWEWTAPVTGWARLGLAGGTRVAITTQAALVPWVGHPVTTSVQYLPDRGAFVNLAEFACEAGTTYRIGLDRSNGGVGVLDFALDVTTWRATSGAEDRIYRFGERATLTYPNPDPAVDGQPRLPVSLRWLSHDPPDMPEIRADDASITVEIGMKRPVDDLVLVATNEVGRTRFSQPVRLRTRPANDDFARATALVPSEAGAVPVVLNLASREPGEPLTTAGPEAGSLWWTWTAEYSGELEWSPTLDPGCSWTMYSGESLGALQELGRADAGHPRLEARVHQGQRYFVCLSGPEGGAAQIPWPEVFAIRNVADATPQLRYKGELDFPLRYVGDPAEFAEVQVVVDYQVVRHSLEPPFAVGLPPGVDARGQAGARAVWARVLFRDRTNVQGTVTIPIRWRARNDNFESRERLSGNDLQWSVSYLNATQEEWESGLGLELLADDRTLWWTWTAPADGVISILSVEHRMLRLLEGSSSENLRLLAMAPARLVTEVRQGQVLCLVAAGTEAQLGDVLLWRFAPRDAPHEPIPLAGASAEMRLSFAQIPQEPPVLQQREFRWTAPGNGMLVFRADSRNTAALRVFDRTVDSAQELSFAFADTDGVAWKNLGVGVTEGHEYAIVLETTEPVVPELVVRLEWMPIRSIDAFANAPTLTGTNLAVCTYLFSSTLEPGEPAWSLPQFPGQPQGSTWVRWVAPTNGFATFDRVGAVAVYVTTGDRADALQVLAGPLENPLRFRAEAGRTYSIAFARIGFGSEIAAGFLRLDSTPGDGTTQPHDLFDWRTPLTGDHFEVFGYGIGAGREYGEPLHGGIYAGRSVWWRWTAPRSGEVRVFSSGNPGTPHELAIYRGTELNQLVPVGQIRSDGFYGETTFRVERGADYALALDGWLGADPQATVGLQLLANEVPTAKFLAVERRGDGTLRATLEGTVGTAFQVQVSTDLTRWADAATGTLESTTTAIDLSPRDSAGAAFYRLRLGD